MVNPEAVVDSGCRSRRVPKGTCTQRYMAVPLGHVLYIEQENFGVGKAPCPGNAMEESAAIKNIVNVSCRHGFLLILRSSPDSVSQDGLISLAWRELEERLGIVILSSSCYKT